MLAMNQIPASNEPSGPAFWFVMSMALLVGFVTAYPMNWWLVSNHLKHGMMTVRASEHPAMDHENMHTNHDGEKVSRSSLVWMTLFSFLAFALGLGLAAALGGGQ